jgi:hypothetical protein
VRKEQKAKSPSTPPKSLGRVELEEHRRATKKREKARREARDLVVAAFKQQRRAKAGEKLTSDEQTLANFAKTLSPVKVLGAGFRLDALEDQDSDAVLSEDEGAIEELMDVTGCGRDEAWDALELSRDWTSTGLPSRCKAALWLKHKEGGTLPAKGRDGEESEDDDCELVMHRTPGGTTHAGRKKSVGKGASAGGGAAGGGELQKVGRDTVRPQHPFSPETNQKAVQSRRNVTSSSSEAEEDDSPLSFSANSSEGSLSQSLSSSDSDSGANSSSEEEERGASAGQKRFNSGAKVPLSCSPRELAARDAKRATRYVRQLALALKIDSVWAREIYDECAAQGTHSYEGLLRYFYRTECTTLLVIGLFTN